jgi:hypothetical protein
LIVKQMIRRCKDSSDQRFKSLLSKIKAVVFLGTPHKGAEFATALDILLSPFKSTFTKQLAYSSDALLDLNSFFCNFAVEECVTVRAYYETQKTKGVHVVNRVTADPGVHGSEPIAVQADHIAICKPTSKDALVYRSICELLTGFAPSGTRKALVPVRSSATHLPVIRRGFDMVTTGWASAASEPAPVAAGDQCLLLTEAPEGLPPDILDDFAYFTTVAADDRRDLDAKLTDAGRIYQIADAKKSKERFAMALRRHIAQPAAVTRYTRLLADVQSRYVRHVGLALSLGHDHAQVDEAIQNKVIDPCVERYSAAGNEITSSLVDSALYYLAGNCHVSWDHE